jgi:hypothetical protein
MQNRKNGPKFYLFQLCHLPRKAVGKEPFADEFFAGCSLPTATCNAVGKAFAICFRAFADCFWQSAKNGIPVVGGPTPFYEMRFLLENGLPDRMLDLISIADVTEIQVSSEQDSRKEASTPAKNSRGQTTYLPNNLIQTIRSEFTTIPPLSPA